MKQIGSIGILFLFSIASFAQGLTNYGANIIVQEEAFVHTGNLQIESGTAIDLDGTVELEGNWINNSSTNPLINMETEPNGLVRFVGNTETAISGNYPTEFENIHVFKENLLLNNSTNSVKGILSLEGTLILNSHQILLLNPSPAALLYLSGYLFSESAPAEGLGGIIWEIGDNTGDYHIPFGSGNDTIDDIKINMTITEAGSSENGTFSFATYPTDTDNFPFPNEISNLDPLDPLATVDRYWKVAPDFGTNPDIELRLFYDNNSLALNTNELIQPDKLQFAQYNNNTTEWTIFEHQSNGTGSVGETIIQGNQLFGWFTLNSPEMELDIPNGITPNGDGYNDQWIITGCDQCKVWIYNRWGNLIFESNNYDNSWNGDNNPSGAYYYVIEQNNGQSHKGDLNILR
ncbi:MAG: gliding motility-associated C-terminal domain-containing protein [Bacteroidales bacterium]|jgi:gliding motility-associated-like protein|nr:gliding motility-associated C-terminal domain-containing protein [Bacteroidales bacterium]